MFTMKRVIIRRFAEISLQDSSNHRYAPVPHIMHDQHVASVLILLPSCRQPHAEQLRKTICMQASYLHVEPNGAANIIWYVGVLK